MSVPPLIDAAWTRTQSSPLVTSAPHSCSLSATATTCAGSQRLTVTSPRVTAPAIIRVPVTIRSGMIAYSVPWSSLTPSIWIVSEPAPTILAPIARKKLAKSTTSGSIATFSSVVDPSARTAASIAFTVAPTLGIRNSIRAPVSRFFRDCAMRQPCSVETRAPSARNAASCISVARVPRMQPPGRGTSARPKRASNGPVTSKEAFSLRTSVYGARWVLTFEASIVTVSSPSRRSRAPSASSSDHMTETSVMCGTRCSVTFPRASNDAAMMGSAAFLAP